MLRSPKELVGPALGFANLTFRAWFEAQFGRAAWDQVHRIPRLTWMDYLRWYRRMIDVPIENETELVDLAGDNDHVLLTLRSSAGVRKVAARRRDPRQRPRRARRRLPAGTVQAARPPVLRAFERADRFRKAARQDRRRDRRRRLGGRQRRRSAGGRCGAGRHAGAARRRPAHQQGHGNRQPRHGPRLHPADPSRSAGRSSSTSPTARFRRRATRCCAARGTRIFR